MSARTRATVAIVVAAIVLLATPQPAYAGLCSTLLDCFLSPATEKALRFLLGLFVLYALALTVPMLAAALAELAGPYIAGLIGSGEARLIGDVPEIGEPFDPFEPFDPGDAPGSGGLTPRGGPGSGVSWPEDWPTFNPGGSWRNCAAVSDAVDRWLGGWAFEPVPDGPVNYPNLLGPDTPGWFNAAGPGAIENGLMSAGEGARGIAWVKNADGFSHVFNVINEGGRVFAIDGQTGAIGSVADVAGFAGYGPNSTWRFFQTNPF
jgi:hypothetical protein